MLNDLNTKPAKVCKKAKKYLDMMYDMPIISLQTMLNKEILENNIKLRALDMLCDQMSRMYDFVQICRQCNDILDDFPKYRHYFQQHGLLSLKDLCNAINQTDYLLLIQKMVEKVGLHITHECHKCRNQGHFCEICKQSKLIFKL